MTKYVCEILSHTANINNIPFQFEFDCNTQLLIYGH